MPHADAHPHAGLLGINNQAPVAVPPVATWNLASACMYASPLSVLSIHRNLDNLETARSHAESRVSACCHIALDAAHGSLVAALSFHERAMLPDFLLHLCCARCHELRGRSEQAREQFEWRRFLKGLWLPLRKVSRSQLSSPLQNILHHSYSPTVWHR